MPAPGSAPTTSKPASPGERNSLCDRPAPVAMLGVPFDKVTMSDTLRIIGEMILSKRPHYLATANVDFAVQALRDVELQRILAEADLVLCDGMPLVWASRLLGNPLPERVTGSDLVPLLLAEAERRGWRIFFLGGAEASLERATANTRLRYPRLQLVGSYSPPFKPLVDMDHEDVLQRLRAARPDIVLVAFGCPKQEKWIRMHFMASGVPVSVGVGATIDFLGGTVRRAPRWMQKTGLEWIFRLLQEPKRLFKRYAVDLVVFGRAIATQWWELRHRSAATPGTESTGIRETTHGISEIVRFGERLDAAAVERYRDLIRLLRASEGHVLADLSQIQFIDSTGLGLLIRLLKQLRADERQLVLVGPSAPVVRALELMRVDGMFTTAPDLAAAHELTRAREGERPVGVDLDISGRVGPLVWTGEVVAANVDAVWNMTQYYLELRNGHTSEVDVRLEGVRFIDSTGVRLMLKVRKHGVKLGMKVRFVGPTPAVLNVLRIVRLDNLLLS